MTVCDCGIVHRRPVNLTTQCDPPGGVVLWGPGGMHLVPPPGPPHMNLTWYVNMGHGPQSGTPVGGRTSEHWQNLTALAIGHILTYAGGAPSQILRWTGRSSQLLHHHRGILPATSSTDLHHCRCFLYLLRASWAGWDPWWGLLPSDPLWGRLPPTPVNCPIIFPLAVCGSMVEHPMEDEGPLQTLWPPLQEIIKEDISIQPPFCFPYWYTFFSPQSFSSSSCLCLAFVT